MALRITVPVAQEQLAPGAPAPRAVPFAVGAGQTLSGAQVDQALVARVQAGDKQAFNVLVQKYQHKLCKLVSRYVRDQTEALDVAQEAFIRAYRALPKFRGDSSFYTWLYRIGLNTAKNHLVARRRRLPDSGIDAQDAQRYDFDPRLNDHDTPEALAIREEIERAVLSAMEELSEDLRTAIILHELEGQSYEEVAAVMACPMGTVRSRIYRARKAIDERLRPLLG
ncbi:MAG: RNA polymerase sigma factor RpoE [Nitrococcus sp.]|nr:RNA polymerase sigma factor RpoE [Nitrococcus sp.]